jgi:hypothetical protein
MVRALVADRIPGDERHPVKRLSSRIKAALYRVPAQLARGVSIESADRQSLLTPEG